MNKVDYRLPGAMPNYEARAEANQEVDRTKRYMQIISILEEAQEPMSAKELAVAMYEQHLIPTSERNFTAPRLTELQQRGIVEPVGKQKCKYTGKSVSVYELIADEKQLDLFGQMESKRREAMR